MKMTTRILLTSMIAVCLLLPGQATAQTHRWTIETVDAQRLVNYPTNSSLELYGDQPRAVFGGDHLYYAYSINDGVDWSVEVVDDSPGVGSSAALALDSSGNPHIAYTDLLNYDLKYAGKDPNNPSQWLITFVDLAVSDYADIAIDPTGQPHISYARGGILYHAWRVCGGSPPSVFCIWYTESLGYSSAYTSIAVDPTNHAHIAFHNPNSSGSVMYAAYLGTGTGNCGPGNQWSCATIQSGHAEGSRGVSIALYGSLPRIAYQDNTDGLIFVYYDTTWNWLEVTGDTISGYSPSLRLTSTGLPRILFSYYDNSVRISYGDAVTGGTFTWEDITGTIYLFNRVSLALKADDTPCALYYRSYLSGEIRYLCRGETSWPVANLVSETGDAGGYTSLQLTDDGQPWIAYQDVQNERLKFAQPNATTEDCGDASGPWKCETISTLNTGHHASLAIDPLSGDPAIAHGYQQSNYDVQFSPYVGSGGNCPGNAAWDCDFVDDDVDWPGGSTALAYDAAGVAHVAYTTKQSPYDLMLATWVGSGGSCVGRPEWDCELATTGVGFSGGHLSMALDSSGQAVISYYNGTGQYVGLAYQVPSGGSACGTGDPTWKCTSVGPVVNADPTDTSLRLASDTDARISYIDDFVNKLYYATVNLTNTDVNNEWVDVSPSYYTALALHAGIPYIAYFTTSHTLKFAERVGDGSGNCGNANDWQCEVVDSGYRVGEYVSLQINSSGVAYISYHDRTLGDLKLAHMLLPFFLPAVVKP